MNVGSSHANGFRYAVPKSAQDPLVTEIRTIEQDLPNKRINIHLAGLIARECANAQGAFSAITNSEDSASKVCADIKENCVRDWREQLLLIEKRKIREVECLLQITLAKLSAESNTCDPCADKNEDNVLKEAQAIFRLAGHNGDPSL